MHITAAKIPVRLTVSNLKEGNITEDHYLELTELGGDYRAAGPDE